MTGCQIINKTLYSLKVECHEGRKLFCNNQSVILTHLCNQGFDGGLPANFLLELYDAEKMELRSQVSNKVPIFEVSNIDPGVPIKLYLYAENAKGASDPAIIDDSFPNQQKHYVEGRLLSLIGTNKQYLLSYTFKGVTDFKAVKDGSTSDNQTSSLSLLLIISSLGGIFVLCILTLCIIVTYRRKVSPL